MKTFEEAFSTLVNLDGDGGAYETDEMDRFEQTGRDIVNTQEAHRMTKYFLHSMIEDKITLEEAIRYAFCQGVLTGMEMEKNDS